MNLSEFLISLGWILGLMVVILLLIGLIFHFTLSQRKKKLLSCIKEETKVVSFASWLFGLEGGIWKTAIGVSARKELIVTCGAASGTGRRGQQARDDSLPALKKLIV